MQEIDVAVIGSGPAGLTAGIYLGRARLNVVIFEKAFAGGQIAISEWIDNFPGSPKGIGGAELSENMRKQAINCGAQFKEAQVVSIKTVGVKCQQLSERCVNNFVITTPESTEYKAQAVIIATGAQPRKLGVPGEDKFIGRGVSYCATCDAPLFKNKVVAVVGGGDTAAQEALFLAKYCAKVYLIHRRDRLRATKILAEKIESRKNIEPVWNSVISEIVGDKKVKAVVAAGKEINCDGVFIFAGIKPNSDLVKDIVTLDKEGYIIADDNMKTSLEGLFACGDVRKKLLRQVVTACGEAATAAVSAQHYVEALKGTEYI